MCQKLQRTILPRHDFAKRAREAGACSDNLKSYLTPKFDPDDDKSTPLVNKGILKIWAPFIWTFCQDSNSISKLFFGTQTQFLHCFSNITDPISALFFHNLTLFLHYFPVSALFWVFRPQLFTVFSVLHPTVEPRSFLDFYVLLCAQHKKSFANPGFWFLSF